MTQDTLFDCRNRLAGCEVVMLADVTTRTSLRASCVVELGQEKLAQLCEQAAQVLNPAQGEAEVFCVLSSPLGNRVFVRAHGQSSEAVCMVFAPNARLDGVERAALDLLDAEFAETTDE